MPKANVNGQRLYYEVHGEGEPLLSIMGLGADTLAWALQLPEWSKHFRTVVFDNRDVGRSSYADGDYEMVDLARDALSLADHLDLESFHLVGVSMGGAIAQELALGWPDRVLSLTLSVTWGGSGEWGREFSRLWARQVERTPFEEHIDNLLRLCLSEAFYDDDERVKWVRQLALDNPHPQRTEGFVRQLESMGRHEARRRLPGLSMPVHVIGAEQDIVVPVWKSKELAELIPDAELTVLDGAPHGVHIECPDALTSAVLDFVRSVVTAAD
jgi:pimeloyl-ACP methyl ester carboxylesterase